MMSTRSLMIAIVAALLFLAAIYYAAAPRNDSTRGDSSSLSGNAPPVPNSGSDATEVATYGPMKPLRSPSDLLVMYSCRDCDSDSPGENPFIAESEAEALWTERSR